MSFEFKIKVTGLELVQKEMNKFKEGYQEAAEAAVYQAGLKVLSASNVLCPVKFNRLLPTGYVAPPTVSAFGTTVEVGYGTKYAPYVHENTSASNWTKPGSGAKFLSRAFHASFSNYKTWLDARIDRNFKKGIVFGGPSGAPTRPKE